MPQIPGINENNRLSVGSPTAAVSPEESRLAGLANAQFGKHVADLGVSLFDKENDAASRGINAKLANEMFKQKLQADLLQSESDMSKLPPEEARKMYEQKANQWNGMAQDFRKNNPLLQDDLTYKKYLGDTLSDINAGNMTFSSMYKKQRLEESTNSFNKLKNETFSSIGMDPNKFNGKIAEISNLIDKLPDSFGDSVWKTKQKEGLKKDALAVMASNAKSKFQYGYQSIETFTTMNKMIDDHGAESGMTPKEVDAMRDSVQKDWYYGMKLAKEEDAAMKQLADMDKNKVANENFTRIHGLIFNTETSAEDKKKALADTMRLRAIGVFDDGMVNLFQGKMDRDNDKMSEEDSRRVSISIQSALTTGKKLTDTQFKTYKKEIDDAAVKGGPLKPEHAAELYRMLNLAREKDLNPEVRDKLAVAKRMIYEVYGGDFISGKFDKPENARIVGGIENSLLTRVYGGGDPISVATALIGKSKPLLGVKNLNEFSADGINYPKKLQEEVGIRSKRYNEEIKRLNKNSSEYKRAHDDYLNFLKTAKTIKTIQEQEKTFMKEVKAEKKVGQ